VPVNSSHGQLVTAQNLRVWVGLGLVVGSSLALGFVSVPALYTFHIRIRTSAFYRGAVTSPSASVNTLANDHPVNFTRRRKFHFAESTLGLFKCTGKNISVKMSNHNKCLVLGHFGPSYLAVAITPFKVIQGHRFWYQSKAHMRLPISH